MLIWVIDLGHVGCKILSIGFFCGSSLLSLLYPPQTSLLCVALLCVMCSCVFVTFAYGVSDQMCHLIISIPKLYTFLLTLYKVLLILCKICKQNNYNKS